MSGYLSKLVLRSVEQPQPIRPRLASLFEAVANLPILSLQATDVTTDNQIQDASPRTAESRATTVEIKSFDNSRSQAATLEAPKVAGVERGPGKTPTEEPSPRPPPVLAERVVTEPNRVENVSASEESIETPQTRQNSADVKQDTAVLDQPLPEIHVAHVIETKLIESLIRSEPPSTSGRETRKVPPEPGTNSVIVKPEIIAGSVQTPEKEDGLGQSSSAIRITIGRVDVRAIMPAPSQPAVTSASQRKGRPPLSLDEYLKQRSGELN